MANHKQIKGLCKYCGKEYAKSGMLRHLDSCKERQKALAEEKGRKCGYYELVIKSAFSNIYWLIVEIPDTATLADLDQFIRDIWVECCGHLSAFYIGDETYDSMPDEDFGWGKPSKDMKIQLRKVLSEGMEFQYEYDFGSTTELTLEVKGYRTGKSEGKGVTILSRNEPPEFVCNVCGKKPAKWIDVYELYNGGDAFWCDDCVKEAKQAGDDEELEELSKLCNSPRAGVCGYNGSSVYPEVFVPDKIAAEEKKKSKKSENRRTLIVIDMQNDFIDGSLGTPEAQAIVPNVKAKIQEYADRGDEIIFTRDTHQKNYLDTPEGRKLPVEHCIEGTHGWQIADGLMPESCEVINKPSFGWTGWAGRTFKKVELVGLCTDICVVSNALILKAEYPEAEISVDASCCAGVTVETHQAALLTMKMCQVDVTAAEDV